MKYLKEKFGKFAVSQKKASKINGGGSGVGSSIGSFNDGPTVGNTYYCCTSNNLGGYNSAGVYNGASETLCGYDRPQKGQDCWAM